MKKLTIYLSVIIALFAILFIIERQSNKVTNEAHAEEAQLLYETTPDKLDPATVKQLNNPEYQKIILPKDLETKLNNKEDVFVYFFSPTCSYCQATTPRLNKIAEEAQVDIVQFNKLEFNQEAVQKYGVTQTPTLVYFEDGVAKDHIVGGFSGTDSDNDARAEKAFQDFFKRNNPAQ